MKTWQDFSAFDQFKGFRYSEMPVEWQRRYDRIHRAEDERRRESWAAARGLVRAGGWLCWRRLLNKRCPISVRCERFDRDIGEPHDCQTLRGDHVHLWRRKGESVPYLLTSQPYETADMIMPRLSAWCARRGLAATVNDDWWWYPGVVMVEIVRSVDATVR